MHEVFKLVTVLYVAGLVLVTSNQYNDMDYDLVWLRRHANVCRHLNSPVTRGNRYDTKSLTLNP